MWALCGALSNPENARIMSQYLRICLSEAEYDWICQHIPEKTECWICQNVSDALHSTYSEHCQTFKIERSAQRIMPGCSCATRNFSGEGKGGEVCGTRTLWKKFRQKHQKRDPTGKHFGVFCRTFKTTFWMENLTQRPSQHFSFKNQDTSWFSKRAGETSPLPLAARLWV